MKLDRIIKEAKRKGRERGERYTNETVGELLGLKSTASVGRISQGQNTTMRTAIRVLNVMECKVIVRFPDGMEVEMTEE